MIHFPTGQTLLIVVLLIVAYVAIIGLASFKLIKSKLPDWEKVYWTIAMVIINVVAAIPFIIYHDYFLSHDKRARYNSVV